MERKRKTSKLLNKTNLCYTFYFFMLSIFTTSSASTITCLDSKCTIFFKSDIDFQKNSKVEIGQGIKSQEKSESSIDWSRRSLGGPGSFPPRCNGKCGKCTPCKPVHVPVPPGTPVTAEYYPEAWRCKCGNKLYMP